jgi:hypothetical protein
VGVRLRYAFVLAVPACSYVFDVPASTQSTSSTTPADAAPDVKPPETDADTREVSVPFCASRTAPSVACIDFDDSAALEGAVDVAPSGRLEIATSTPLSPPRALLAVASEGKASLTRTFGRLDGVSVDFALLVSAWTGNADATTIELADGCRVALTGEDGQWSVTQSCASGGVLVTRSNRSIEPSRWHRFGLSIRFGAPKSVALAIDGVREIDVAGLDALSGTSVGVTLGIASVRAPQGSPSSIVVFEDDVLVTTP